MSDFYHCSSRCTFFVVLRLCYYFTSMELFFFSCCNKENTAYWFEKIKNRDAKNKAWDYMLENKMWSKGRVESLTEVVEFSLEKEKVLQFFLPSHLAALIQKYLNGNPPIWKVLFASVDSKKQEDKRPLKNHWLSNPFLKPAWVAVSASSFAFLMYKGIRKPTAPPNPRCLSPGTIRLPWQGKEKRLHFNDRLVPPDFFFFFCFSSLGH